MQYGTDVFRFRRQSLLKTTEPLDATNETSVYGFSISGTQPTGTERRIIFQVDGLLYKFDGNTLEEYKYPGDFEDVLEYGNTVGELLAVTSIQSWCGKKIYPIIALDAPEDSPVMPSIKIMLNVNSYNDVYTKTETSPVYDLTTDDGAEGKIIDVELEPDLVGVAKITPRVRLKSGNVWGEWQVPESATGKTASAVQWKATHVLTKLDGTDTSKIGKFRVDYTTNSARLTADKIEIVTAPQSFSSGLGTCYALIKHDELRDAQIKAYVKYIPENSSRTRIKIGTATGESQTLILGVESEVTDEESGITSTQRIPDANIDPATIQLFANGIKFNDFYYDTENSSVTFTQRVNADISASYEYDLPVEDWAEMTLQASGEIGGTFAKRFVYRPSTSTTKYYSGAVKFVIEKLSGKVDNSLLGYATGKEQKFFINHRAQKESFVCSGDWKFDETTQIVSVIHEEGAEIYCSYDYAGEIPEVYGIVAGWIPAM